MAKCNLSPEEREKALGLKEWGRYFAEEWDLLRDQFSQYLFVQKDSEGLDWWSSCCRDRGFELGKRGKLYKLKHNDYCECPSCGRGLRIKLLGRVKSGTKLHETCPISFVSVTEDGAVLIESGVGMWDFDYEHDMSESFYPKVRYYIAPGKVQQWKRPLNMDLWTASYKPGAWVPTVNVGEPFQTNVMYGFDGYGSFIGLYKLAWSELKYSAIDRYFEEYHNVDIFNSRTPLRLVPQYLAEYAMRPSIEMLAKLGLHEFICELIRDRKTNGSTVNWGAKSPQDFCRLTKKEFKVLQENLTPMGLRTYRMLKREGMIHKPEEALPIISFTREADITKFISICKRAGADIVKAGKYISQPSGKTHWLDYVEMAIQLNYDLSDEQVLFPKNLAERHDAAAAAIKHNADAISQENYKKRRKQLEKKYSFSLGGYRIIVPESAQAIIDEGKTLHHCVGGYAARHIEGKTTILFFRRERKPDTSFVTIELDDDGKVRQIHGYKNERYRNARAPEETFKWFFSEWQRWYRQGSHRLPDGSPDIKKEKTA